MKSTVEQLTAEERKALALFYDTEAYKALEKLIGFEKTQYAEQHVGQLEIGQIRYLTGMVGSLNKLLNLLQENYKESVKKQKS